MLALLFNTLPHDLLKYGNMKDSTTRKLLLRSVQKTIFFNNSYITFSQSELYYKDAFCFC